MKLVVIGLGQCGGRIADEFARLNKRARAQRGTDIIFDAFAVNTDAGDLSGLSTIKSDYRHRILIGGRKTGGHGVGKINELGAEVAKEDADKVVDAIKAAPRFFETDAILLVAGSAGGTGSGAIPILTQYIKDRYMDKPVYSLIILPFEHEEITERRAIYNSATCLKSAYSVADAIILVDNQRYVSKDYSLRDNIAKINSMIVEPFFNLLCAGEEKKAKYIGAKTLDTGDISQTMTGWVVIGHGKAQLPLFRFPFVRHDFRGKGSQTDRGIQAMDEALSDLSLRCNPADAGRVLFLVSAPANETNVDLIKGLGRHLKDLAPQAIIRDGDYPREKGTMDVTIILADLAEVEKVKHYYSDALSFARDVKKRYEEVKDKRKELDELARDLPTLL